MRPSATLAVLIALSTALTAVAQRDDDGSRPPGAPASGGFSLGDTFRSIRDRLPGRAAASGPAAEPAAEAARPAAPLKIKEFDTRSRLPPTWNDAHCRNLVEPFDTVDSALSLAKFKAEKETRSWAERLLSGGKGRPDARFDVREAARQVNWLPMEVENRLGSQLHLQQASKLLGENKSGKEAYQRARRLLAAVVGHVNEPHPYKFQIFVTTDAGGNAESGPGGYIYVDQDLVKKANVEPRARFAIAHEVAHVLQRHRTRETQMRLSDGVDSLDDLAKLIASPQAGIDTMVKKGLDLKRLFVRHSEEQELQADGCGVRLVDAMSDNRAEVVRSVDAFLEGLPPPTAAAPPGPARKAEAIDAVFTELSDVELSRHPTTEQRRKNLAEVLTDLRTGK